MINLKEKFNNYQWLRSWRPYFLILALGFLLYSQALFFDYSYLDDNELIVGKMEILQNSKNIPLIFSTDAFLSNNKVYYRPILNLSFMFDTQFSEGMAFFYHFSNIIFHIFCVILIFYFLQKLNYSKALSFFLSLIFLVHPVLTQAVAWLPGRNDSLLTIFILLSFLSLLKFLENPRFKFYLLYLLFFFVALLTKETAALLPLLIIYYCLFIDSGKALKSDKYLLLLGTGAMMFVWFLMRNFALGGDPTNYFSAVTSIVKNLPAILVGFGKLLLPVNLSVFPILEDSTIIFGIISLIGLAAGIFISKQRKNNLFIFGIIWLLFFLLPSFIKLNNLADFLEHRLYLSMIGFLIILAEIDYIKKLDFSNKKIKLFSAGLIFILMILTFWHSTNFRNRISFWQAAAKSSPHSPLTQKNLGAMYYLDGNLDAAYHYYSKSLELNPIEPMIHNNLGLIYFERGEFLKAENEFKQELNLYPYYDKALLNLANLYYKQGRSVEAKYLYETTLRENPYSYEAYQGLINLAKPLR